MQYVANSPPHTIHGTTKGDQFLPPRFLKKTDRFAKTIVFCVDQDHASDIRRELSNLNADLVTQHPEYVYRVTADEGDIGRGHLSRFQDVDTTVPIDLLCFLAFNAPLRTRRERAQRLRNERKDFFDRYSPEAQRILEELLEKYAVHGEAQFVLPDALHIPPISDYGKPGEIIRFFGGPQQLRQAVTDLQNLLYAA